MRFSLILQLRVNIWFIGQLEFPDSSSTSPPPVPSGAFLAYSPETKRNRIKRANEPSSSQLLFNRTPRVNGLEEYIPLISNLFQDDPRVE